MRRRAEAIVAAAHVGEADRILEAGCGTGELARLLAEGTRARVTGVDLCRPFIEQASARFSGERLDFVAADLGSEADVERLGAGFKAVVGNGILHHLYSRIDDALPRLARLLVPGGRLVFWEPNLWNPYVFAIFSFGPLRKLAKLEPDEMAFTPGWIKDHLQRAGFAGLEVSFRDFLVPVVPRPLVPVVVKAGDLVEKVPGVNRLAQSLFIAATKA